MGNLKINGANAGGKYQVCGPLESDPCPITSPWQTNNIYGSFGSDGFKIALLPGSYRLQVTTQNDVFMGILPITVVSGEILNLATTAAS